MAKYTVTLEKAKETIRYLAAATYPDDPKYAPGERPHAWVASLDPERVRWFLEDTGGAAFVINDLRKCQGPIRVRPRKRRPFRRFHGTLAPADGPW